MRARMREERGNVLVISVTMLALMMALGSAALSTVDTQTDVVMKERRHESTFNLAEGVLNAQTFVLARLGTGSATSQFPAYCAPASTEALCPDGDQIARSYDPAVQGDYTGATWTTEVRDNPSGTFYNSTTVSSAPRYDANGDQQLWVRAKAQARGRQREIVALISVEFRPIDFPRFALAGGWFKTSNNGRKVIVDATGSLGVGVRCGLPPQSSSCLDYQPSKGQLEPAGAYQLNYPSTPGVLPDELRALEDQARASGTYFSGCPSNPNGQVVVIESGACSYNNSAPAAPGGAKCCNTSAKPGLLIMKCGSLSFGGNIEFYGLVYVPNVSSSGSWCSSGAVITTQGTSLIKGGAIVDGPGGIVSGSSGMNIQFNPNAFDNIRTTGTAGVVQNTWREVPDDN
jgi:Tfp pilus assembly protein PilX